MQGHTVPSASPLASPFTRLIEVAEKQDKLSGIREILRVIAESFDAEGCILWEVSPGNEPIEERKIFVLAEYFQGDWPPGWQHLAMSSRTGTAILRREPQAVNDIEEAKRSLPEAARNYLDERHVQAACVVPINLRGGETAAIDLYRTRPQPFREEEIEHLKELGSRILPYLYNSLVNHVGLELLHRVTHLIRSAGPIPADRTQKGARIRFQETLRGIVDLVADTFNSLECSIYLEDQFIEPLVYRLEATRWPWVGRKQPEAYPRGHGLTGYCIERQTPVRIFDLGRYQEDLAFIQQQYPGIQWTDPVDLKGAVREALSLHGELPPLSFMCAPIIWESRSLGALRCCVTQTGPHYFDDRQVRFLCLVAEQVGEWWGNHIGMKRGNLENSRWKTLVEGVSRLNTLVHDELNKREPTEQRMFDQALKISTEINSQAEILSVRLVDETAKELRYAATLGRAWERGGPKDVAERKSRRYSLKGDSAGAHVVRTGRLLVEPDTDRSQFKGELFPEVRTKIVAPISSGNKVYGVLDVRAMRPGSFPPHAEIFAELLGRQLGLYHFLALKSQELNKAQSDLRDSLAMQQRLYEDFQHQVKTPVIMAHQQVQTAVRSLKSGRLTPGDLYALRGVCRKAERVTTNMGLFAALAREERIKVNWKILRYEELVQTLSDSTEDHKVMVPPAWDLRFVTETESFQVLHTASVYADHALFEQALSNLLDNAGKYSFPRTRISIRGGLARHGQYFFIAVTNHGFEVTVAERHQLTERGYRGTKAARSTGEGAGIGLWIAHKIMEAHGGLLEILPTNEKGVNEFRLLFPLGIPKDLPHEQ